MNCTELIQSFIGGARPFYHDVGKSDALSFELVTVDGRTVAQACFNANVLQAHNRRTFCEVEAKTTDLHQIVEMYLLGKMLANGPKTFKFDQLTCEALEHTTLNLPLEDYEQPFDTVHIELPADYQLSAGRLRGRRPDRQPFKTGVTRTGFCGRPSRPDPATADGVNILQFTADHQHGVLADTTCQTMEEHLFDNFRAKPFYSGSISTNDPEIDVAVAVLRIAFNACLLADQCGVRCLGPTNQAQAERLKRRIESGPAKRRVDNERELRELPMLYAFSQEVELYHQSGQPSAAAAIGGWSTKPHWRRGHWRQQACGTGLAERKRIRISPVFVNADRFGGALADTTVTYRLPSHG